MTKPSQLGQFEQILCVRFALWKGERCLVDFAFQGSDDTLLQAAHINSSFCALQHLLKHYIDSLAASFAIPFVCFRHDLLHKAQVHIENEWSNFVHLQNIRQAKIMRWRENDVFNSIFMFSAKQSYILRNRKLTQFRMNTQRKKLFTSWYAMLLAKFVSFHATS